MLDLAEWDRLSSSDRLTEAQRLARELPHGFAFKGFEPVEWEGTHREVAVYGFDNAEFILVPGGEVTLGFDGLSFVPSPEQLASFNEDEETFGINDPIQEYVDHCTTPVRRARLAPMLMERESRDGQAVPASIDEPKLRELAVSESKDSGIVEFHVGDQHAWIEFRDGQPLRAWRLVIRPPEMLRSDLKATGFRLPTSDEWEYACGAGARTLFRWGNTSPDDRYPQDDLQSWRGSKPSGTPQFPQNWQKHRQLNALGLVIAHDPHVMEQVDETDVVRGGDGGTASCAGTGAFLQWLPLATAYLQPEFGTLADEFGCIRRVFSLR